MNPTVPLTCMMVALLSGCKSRTPEPEKPGPPITDKIWALKELEGQPLDSSSSVNPPTLLLSISDSRASGNAGCNRMAGPYTLGDGTLEFGPMVMTRMACPAMDLETRFTNALSAVRQYRLEGNQLLLLAQGRALARFAPASAE